MFYALIKLVFMFIVGIFVFINKIYNVTKEKLVFLTDNIGISIYRIELLAIIIAVLNVYISLVTTDIVAESSISIFEFVSSVLLIPVILAEILEAKKS